VKKSLTNKDKKKIFLHVGMAKAGSTTFQVSLKRVVDGSMRIFLPRDDLMNKVISFLSSPVESEKTKIREQLQQFSETKIIFSSEFLIGHPSNGFLAMERNLTLLEDLFCQPNYLVFFREPSALVRSMYFHGLRKGVSINLAEYARQDMGSRSVAIKPTFIDGTDFRIFEYSELFNPYVALGRRCLFVDFESYFDRSHDLERKKLADFIGLDWKENRSNFEPSIQVNIALPDFYFLPAIYKSRGRWITVAFMYGLTKVCRLLGIKNYWKFLMISKYLNVAKRFLTLQERENLMEELQQQASFIKTHHEANYEAFRNRR